MVHSENLSELKSNFGKLFNKLFNSVSFKVDKSPKLNDIFRAFSGFSILFEFKTSDVCDFAKVNEPISVNARDKNKFFVILKYFA